MARNSHKDSTSQNNNLASDHASIQRKDTAQVVWTSADVTGLFVDAFERGALPGLELLGYQSARPGSLPRAFLRHKTTRQVFLYEMECTTGCPRRSKGIKLVG